MADHPEVLEDERSTGAMVRDIVGDIERMIRAEVKLAKTELAEKVAQAKSAGLLLGVAAVGGLLAAACFVAVMIAALDLVLSLWLAASIVGVLLGGCAAGAFALGRVAMKQVQPVLPQTAETAREVTEWLKQRTS